MARIHCIRIPAGPCPVAIPTGDISLARISTWVKGLQEYYRLRNESLMLEGAEYFVECDNELSPEDCATFLVGLRSVYHGEPAAGTAAERDSTDRV